MWQRLRLNRFVVLGRVGMDLHADPPGAKIETARSYSAAIGGSAGNIAAALARQGAEVALLSRVSDDPVGRFCLAELAGYGVATRHVRVLGGSARTSLALTETVPSACQTVLYRNGAADFALSAGDVAAVDFAAVGALVVTGTALAAQPSRSATELAIAQARSAGALIVLDLDYRAYSWAAPSEAAQICSTVAEICDVVIGNDDEFGLLAGGYGAGRALAAALAQNVALFTVYKRGAEGSETFTREGGFASGIFAVPARKPTGAGDGFMGGLLAALAQGAPLPDAVRAGSATAAMIVAGIGCAPASPDSAALRTFLATQEGQNAHRPL